MPKFYTVICPTCQTKRQLKGRPRGEECYSCANRRKKIGKYKPFGIRKTKYLTGLREDGTRDYLHRIIMEKHIGRRLTSEEHVHHIDGDRSNNLVSNLEILTHSEHSSEHIRERNKKEGLHIRAANIRWGNI